MRQRHEAHHDVCKQFHFIISINVNVAAVPLPQRGRREGQQRSCWRGEGGSLQFFRIGQPHDTRVLWIKWGQVNATRPRYGGGHQGRINERLRRVRAEINFPDTSVHRRRQRSDPIGEKHHVVVAGQRRGKALNRRHKVRRTVHRRFSACRASTVVLVTISPPASCRDAAGGTFMSSISLRNSGVGKRSV